jgi:murein DD-endopeptidase MepM/ murein hydrolase activator NlpD
MENSQTINASLAPVLLRHQADFGPVLPVDLNGLNVARLDFSANNPRVAFAELHDTAAFEALVHSMLAEKQASIGVGGYLENRVIYRRSQHFGLGDTAEARSLHLGIDVWLAAGVPVLAPLPAVVYGMGNNNNFGDYGYTVVLQHELEGVVFYTLYGHLGGVEWHQMQPGQVLQKGEAFASVGPYPENGDWPPHLHFQVIADMQGRVSDFPGVARPTERDYWAALCPDANLVLQCRLLG